MFQIGTEYELVLMYYRTEFIILGTAEFHNGNPVAGLAIQVNREKYRENWQN